MVWLFPGVEVSEIAGKEQLSSSSLACLLCLSPGTLVPLCPVKLFSHNVSLLQSSDPRGCFPCCSWSFAEQNDFFLH